MTALTAIEREAARVACAFGVSVWHRRKEVPQGVGLVTELRSRRSGVAVECCLNESGIVSIDVGEALNGWCRVVLLLSIRRWHYYPHPFFNELMARGLYCLGFEDQAVLSQLPALSMHEKMEARLTMPREFWPDAWLRDLEKGAIYKT